MIRVIECVRPLPDLGWEVGQRLYCRDSRDVYCDPRGDGHIGVQPTVVPGTRRYWQEVEPIAIGEAPEGVRRWLQEDARKAEAALAEAREVLARAHARVEQLEGLVRELGAGLEEP